MKRLMVAAACLLAMSATAFAQLAGGTVAGQVSDPQGAVLSGSEVVVRGSDRTVEAATDAAGRFRLLNLAPGSYHITISHPGFQPFTLESVDVRVGTTADVVARLALEPVTVTVSVDAVADTRSTGTATNFTSGDLQRTPTARDPFALLRSVPGVLLDRVNVAGNETGQQSQLVSKGTRGTDTVWTLDGVVVTDMASAGVSPIYYNFDDFEEIQVATSGQDIRQPTGGLGVNMVVRRGTNDFRGVARGYFTSDSLEGVNLPDELRARGVTAATADHTTQLSDLGLDAGGPLVRDRLWFHASYSEQDVRLVRAGLPDRTRIKSPNLKVNWQASSRDLVSFLYFDGDKVKTGRQPSGTATILFPAATALQEQHNAYADNPFHGLWKLEDNHTVGSALFVTATAAYFNTGFQLDPQGGIDQTSGRSIRLSRSFGSTVRSWNVRPQVNLNADATAFRVVRGMGHDVRVGSGWRRVTAESGTVWPGNGFLALDNSAADRRVRIFREGRGVNRVELFHAYMGDTVRQGRLTLEAGLRFDRQSGAALAGETRANAALPELVPGIRFAGADLPFVWNTWSPRVGATFDLRGNGSVILRGSASRFAGQLTTALPGFVNTTSAAGFREFRWNDVNSDGLATTDEVLFDLPTSVGGGFSLAAPTAAPVSPNQLDPAMRAPRTTSAVAGVDVRLADFLRLSTSYSYSRTSNHVGAVARRIGFTVADYAPGTPLSGTLPDGLAYSIPTWIPNPAAIVAGGGGFRMGNTPDYYTDYHGLEVALERRETSGSRWSARLAGSWNHAREHYGPDGLVNFMGNPTRTETEMLVDGGQYAPQNGTAGVFLNARWQVNGSASYRLPGRVEVAGNLFGRQGYPFVPVRNVSLGADAFTVAVVPTVDTYRLPNIWMTDLRVSRPITFGVARVRVLADVFNLFNASTELQRVRNLDAPTYRVIGQTLSPRILRLGLTVGF